MKAILRSGFLALAVFVALAVPASALGGELSRRDIRRSTEWEPSGCYKPSEPYFSIYDVDSFNEAVDEFNSYNDEIAQFIECVSSEASDDFRTLKRIIEESLDTQVSEAQNSLDSAQSSLEMQRP